MARSGNLGLGIDFQPGMQDGLVNNRGVEMIHEIGVACTCRGGDVYASTRDDGRERRGEPFCSRCGQDGYIFRDPKLIVGIFTSARFQRNVLDAGTYQPGDAIFSPRPNMDSCNSENPRKIGTLDKLTSTWPEPLDEGHVLIRGSGSLAAAEGIKTELNDNEDRLWYEPAGALWCEDENDITYTEGVDFELGPGRIIRWIGAQPNFGVKYSIKYNAYFEWIVWQPPGERQDRSGNLGELVNLRKRHVQIVNTSPYATSEDKRSLQSRISC